MAILKLPFLKKKRPDEPLSYWNQEWDYRVWENVPYERHILPHSQRAFFIDPDYIRERYHAGEVPEHYDVRGGWVHQLALMENGDSHPWSMELNTRLRWMPMILELHEGVDNPIIDDTILATPCKTTTYAVDRGGTKFDLNEMDRDYRITKVEPGAQRLWEIIGRDPAEAYGVFLDRHDIGKLFPGKARTAFFAKARLYTAEQLLALMNPPKGRNLFEPKRRYDFPYQHKVGDWVCFQVKDDFSGFIPMEPTKATWDSPAPLRSRANHVFIHRDDHGWRFLFVLKGKASEGSIVSFRSHYIDVQHCFIIHVAHEDTTAEKRTWRGLPFPLQETINRIPGMSMALVRALSELRAKIRALPYPLDRWRDNPVVKYGHVVTLYPQGSTFVSYHTTGRKIRSDVHDMGSQFILSRLGHGLPVNHLRPLHPVDAPVARKGLGTKRVIDL